MKRLIAIAVLAILAGAGAWVWAQDGSVVSRRVGQKVALSVQFAETP
jgi:hypothetical protein